jgi:flagella basal body P-ring formation protein FlgA
MNFANVIKSVAAAIASLGIVMSVHAVESWQLSTDVQVDSRGIFAADLVNGPAVASVPRVSMGSAPAVGKTIVLTRAQIADWLKKNAPDVTATNWTGVDKVRVTRKARMIEETEIKDLLTTVLQQQNVREKGELELRMNHAWSPMQIPDEPISVKILDLPAAGVTPNFIVRFELRTGNELIGNYQVPLQARILRDVWVARSTLQRGQLLQDADITQEKRDILTLRDAITKLPTNDRGVEIGESIQAGAALGPRSFRLRPVIFRGAVADAMVQEGGLTISVKVEVLEDGVPGQTVRVRNVKSKKEFRGKVQNEETILVYL